MSPATAARAGRRTILPGNLGFFLTENLLAARAQSMFPTNGAGPDEDVNIYLAHLLTRFLTGHHDHRVQFASGPLFTPPRTTNRRQSAAYYQANGDHRLLYLGLFDRGDGIRRRTSLHGLTTAETRQRDLSVGQVCYEQAANYLRNRTQSAAAQVAIFDKIAANFEEYVHVLGTLATRELGFHAVLDENALSRLLGTVPAMADDSQLVAELLAAPPPPAALDSFLELWLVHQKHPTATTARRLRNMAHHLGLANQPLT